MSTRKGHNTIKVGTKVRPKSKGGLELADVPVNGKYLQVRRVSGVFLSGGTGKVVETVRVTIDYDSWPRTCEYELGKAVFVNCLVHTDDGHKGWAGRGALVRADDQV